MHQQRSTHPRDWMTRAAWQWVVCRVTQLVPSRPRPQPQVPSPRSQWPFRPLGLPSDAELGGGGCRGLLLLVLVIGKWIYSIISARRQPQRQCYRVDVRAAWRRTWARAFGCVQYNTYIHTYMNEGRGAEEGATEGEKSGYVM